jgi:hypothetical protein
MARERQLPERREGWIADVERNQPELPAVHLGRQDLSTPPTGRRTDPAQIQQALAKRLKFARCMRSHGVPNYPDPNPANPNVVHLLGIDPSSPQFQNAQKTCETLVPGTGAK